MAARRGRKSRAASAPDDVGPRSTTPPRAVRLHTFERGELLDGITSGLPDNGSATPSHEYETAWFVWELLRRSPYRENCPGPPRNWDEPFPDPLPDGSCPAEHAKCGVELQRWIAPRRGPPLLVLDGRMGADGYPIEFPDVVGRGSPFVSVSLDIRASDEEIVECVRVIRAHVGVSIARTRASRTFWGKQLGPVVARDYWVRARDPAAPRDIAARLARERLEALGLGGRQLDARDPALLEMKRVLRNLFSRMDDAVRVDPWRPYRWGAAYAVRGTVRRAVPWFVQAVEHGTDGEAVT